MKLNYETCLVGEKVTLVPYRPEHVPKYHEWMKDPALLEATGSEPLSLSEEVEMQQSWRDDPDKCTFIVHRTTVRDAAASKIDSRGFDVNDNLLYMVGDVNLFLSEIDDEEQEDESGLSNNYNATGLSASTETHPTRRLQAEIDIMIAEHDYRRKGLGRAASCAMMLYGLSELGIERFFCKIIEDNHASIQLFSSLGFRQCDYAACFKQVELELHIKSKEVVIQMLKSQGGAYDKIPCPLTTTANGDNAFTTGNSTSNTPNPLYRYVRSPTRGRCLVATTKIQEGQLIFVERPLVALQSMGNVFDGALVCTYCMSFCGSPEQAIRIAADPACLAEITTTESMATKSLSSESTCAQEHDLILCRHKCGHVYCCRECQEDDWEWGAHKELCTGWIPEEEPEGNEKHDESTSNAVLSVEPTGSTGASMHPLLQFKIHARETNEIFLLIATWMVRITKQNVPYHDNDSDNTHPYTDFMMNPWWDVKTQETLRGATLQPGAFAEAISLEKTLKQLCEESHSYLQQALPEELRRSPWLTALGMARLIGSLEQNCLGIRRKHAVHRNIMQDSELRQQLHKEIIQCLKRAGMIGHEEMNGDSEEAGDDAESEDADLGVDLDSNEPSGEDSSAVDEEWDYSCDDIAQFLAGFPAHTKVDMDDEWDEVFRPLDGTAHFTVATKMNHSCEPNVILLYKTRGWGKEHPLVAYCVALRDISEDEELTICYIDANEPVEKRQAALANYGFQCSCKKCETELSTGPSECAKPEMEDFTDPDDLFGSDNDVDSYAVDEDLNECKGTASNTTDTTGDEALLQMAEQIDSVLNQSLHAAIPTTHLASVANYVVRIGSSVLVDRQTLEENGSAATVESLLKQCMEAVQNRDFASCRIVGADLEEFLYNQLRNNGSFDDTNTRAAYWCAAVTASIGHANNGAFLTAMKYLDKGAILGVVRQDFPGFYSYVETFASQMACGPCPPAIDCPIPDSRDPSFEELFRTTGLSQPIAFPVEEKKGDPSLIRTFLDSDDRNKPFVVRGLAGKWPSIDKWRDMATLAREHGYRLVPIEIGNMKGGMREEIVSLRHLIKAYLAESATIDCWSLQDATNEENASKIGYLAQHPLLDQIPALYSDVDPTPCGIKPTNVNLWMGTGGTRTPLHFDSYDNLLVHLVGAKYVRLYAREDTPKLYVSTNKTYGLQGNMSDLDCEREDFVQHPLAKDCPYEEVLLLPGDCLYIPSQHWHYVRSLSTSISVNYWF